MRTLLPLSKWHNDPAYHQLTTLRTELERTLRAELDKQPPTPRQTFDLGHAAGGIFEAVEHGLFPVLADTADQLMLPLHATGWSISPELHKLLNGLEAIGRRRLKQQVVRL